MRNLQNLQKQNRAALALLRGPLKGAAALAIVAVVMIATDAFAQGVPSGLASITDKMDQIKTLCRVMAGIIVGIGAIWCGVKFVKGDHDSWAYVWKFGLGAVMVFASGDIVTWLGNG